MYYEIYNVMCLYHYNNAKNNYLLLKVITNAVIKTIGA